MDQRSDTKRARRVARQANQRIQAIFMQHQEACPIVRIPEKYRHKRVWLRSRQTIVQGQQLRWTPWLLILVVHIREAMAPL
ncbi:hypothetical protein I070019H7_01790 [Bifidobacterium longum]|nr:hypothetical protein BLGT_01050 [Bifidobacterium longum subsp. longum GT15]KEY22992.1 hypothetical protein BL71B_05905 [Bifidobacterium longum subsp. longum 7-1B]